MTSESPLAALECTSSRLNVNHDTSHSCAGKTVESSCSRGSPAIESTKHSPQDQSAAGDARSRVAQFKWSPAGDVSGASTSTGHSAATATTSDASLTTASLILPSASSLLSQPIFVAIKTSPLILVPCSFDSASGSLSILPSFNPASLDSPEDAAPHECADAPNVISLSNATIVNCNGNSHLHASDHSRSNSPLSGDNLTRKSTSSGATNCNKLLSSRRKLLTSSKSLLINGDNSYNNHSTSIAHNSSHNDMNSGTSVQSAAAVLAAFASSSSSSSSSSSTCLNASSDLQSDMKSQQQQLINAKCDNSSLSTLTLPLDLSSRSILLSSVNSTHNQAQQQHSHHSSLANSANSALPVNCNVASYINSLVPGNNLHNVSALIQAMIGNAHCTSNSPHQSNPNHSLVNNLSTLAALQAALQSNVQCNDVNCNCKGGNSCASDIATGGTILNDSSAATTTGNTSSGTVNTGTSNVGHIKRRRASNAIVITPGSSSFLSKPLHSDLESSSSSPPACLSPIAAPTPTSASSATVASGNNNSSNAVPPPSLLLPPSDLNQLLAAAVAQQQQQRSVNCVINSNNVAATSSATATIAPVVVNGTTAGSGGLETTAVKQGTHRCEDCNIVFYRQENYLVHKANYCASRRGSTGGSSNNCNSDRNNHPANKDNVNKCNVNGLSSTSSSPISSSSSNVAVTMSLNNLCKSTQPSETNSNSLSRLNHEQVHRSSSQMSSGAESTDHVPSSSPEVSQDAINPLSLAVALNGSSTGASSASTANGASSAAPGSGGSLTAASRSINSSSPSPPLPLTLPSASSAPVASATTTSSSSSSSSSSSMAAAAALAASIAVNGSIVQYFCVSCGIRFTSLDTLQAHQTFYCLKRSSIAAVAAAAAAANNVAAIASSSSCVSPKLSSLDCKSEPIDSLSDHLSSHSLGHPSSSKSNSNNESSSRATASTSSSNQQSFKCTICGYKGHTIRGMRTHVRMHSDQLLPGTCEETFIQSMDPTIDISALTANSGAHSNSKMNSRRRAAASSLPASSNGKRKKTLPFLRC